MKKLVLALSAVAAFTGSAIAADLPARTYSKAPAMVAVAPSWTGCYVGGGGGYGLWNQENTAFDDTTTPRTQVTQTTTSGGRGYLGTVQGGCDYQFGLASYNLVVGAFGDYDFESLKGHTEIPNFGAVANEKMSSSWTVGGRIGVLVTPNLLTYFSAGYTQATFDRMDVFSLALPVIFGNLYANKQTYKGYFLGAGDEYALNFLPGLFWKTEYRVAEFNTATNPFINATTNIPFGESMDSKKWVQTVRSELVYRFNWSGPVVAKY